MEPRIQYAKTKDGVSIAYATTGERDSSPIAGAPGGTFMVDWGEMKAWIYAASRSSRLLEEWE